MKFRKGQKVYYFEQVDIYMRRIVTAIIEGATKDLLTGKVTYQAVIPTSLTSVFSDKIYKEHKDELAYFELMTRIKSLEVVSI